ncbi:hypothetical protein K439DRAFT_1245623, partial [Ramaria rubella]
VPQQVLLRDVDTWWDTVFFMIRRLCHLHPAFDYFLAQPKNADLKDLRMKKNEWVVLQDFKMVLMIPHQVQMVMSKEATPVLSGAIPAFETFMSLWEAHAEKHEQL